MPRSAIVFAIKRALPSVVSIRSVNGSKPVNDEYSVSSEAEEGLTSQKQQLGGSGFIVAPNGLIVTNKHVVPDLNGEYEVVLNNTEIYPARVLAHDPSTDIAFVKIAKGGLRTMKLGGTRTLELGEEVVAIGNALGQFVNTASAGIVSGLSRSLVAALDQEGTTEELEGLIQTDAAINPGNSGGPLVNTKGEAIGVNIATVLDAQSVGFAIPIDTIRRDIAELQRYGRIRKGYLGIRYIPVDETIAKEFGLLYRRGALIASDTTMPAISPDGPAHRAGLLENDIIIAMNSKSVSSRMPLSAILARTKIGKPLTLTVLRGKKRLRITVTPVEWESQKLFGGQPRLTEEDAGRE